MPIEADLTDEDAIPIYMRISDKVLHLRRLGMTYTNIAERLGINPWMAKKGARWGNMHIPEQIDSSFFSFRLFFSTINPYGQTAVQIPQTCPL